MTIENTKNVYCKLYNEILKGNENFVDEILYFENELELHIRQGSVVLSPVVKNRYGWKELMQSELNKHPIKAEGEWEW